MSIPWIQGVAERTRPVCLSGMSGAEKGYWLCQYFKAHPGPIWITTPTIKDTENWLADLAFFGGDDLPVYEFPPYHVLPMKSLSYHNTVAAKRIRHLYRLMAENKPMITVAPVSAVVQQLIPKSILSDYADVLMVGEDVDVDSLVARLIAGGYERTTVVEAAGDFCIRGGILDIFSPMYDDPIRVELFGDTVDAIRFFSVSTQRKTEPLQEAILLPAKETIISARSLDGILGRVRKGAADAGIPASKIRDIITRLKEEGGFAGVESLLPFVYPDLSSVWDYVPPQTLILNDRPSDLGREAGVFIQQVEDHVRRSVQDQKLAAPVDSLCQPWPDALASVAEKLPVATAEVCVQDLKHPMEEISPGVTHNTGLSAEIKENQDREHLLGPLSEWINNQRDSGRTVVLVCATPAQADRLMSLLAPYGLAPQVLSTFPDPGRVRGMLYIVMGRLSAGFVWPEAGVAVVTEDEIFGAKFRRKRSGRSSAKASFLSLDELNQGDIVVHASHGLGRYHGLEKLSMGGVTNDFVLVTYRDEDRLYLPVDRLNMIQKYVGVDGHDAILDKMGGKSWDKAKEKAKKEVEKLAGELLGLYAERKAAPGHAYAPPDALFRDFEAAFPYEETSGQLKAINDVLRDMEQTRPMDRLVCGDVGYGKTEVALRAAFKAVSDGKQVAVLVPTTVLAEQHAVSFAERFSRYPVRVACLSRFRTTAEQRAILADAEKGAVDVVIGTHRLLQKDIHFKDIGLLIIDEEQRFGVKHKEKLKTLRRDVDVLALSATPIPRTLHMSLMGIRDISVIATPPEERQPIQSYVSVYDDTVVGEAITREIKRSGQVFFVHNNINTIDGMADRVQKQVPDAVIRVAHGRMAAADLENVMMAFINKKVDVLVCTTIIESGLDIPSANTMIINRADRFGLSQIYQLRGRVGRGDAQAYAYLFIPDEDALSRDAQKRLRVLMEHTDLGAGFQIAMSDLQIRGGGAALGSSQSGHIAAVGYDMFLKLMDEAIADIKGEPRMPALEPEINIAMSAYVPESYVPDIDQRLSIYRRLSRMTQVKEIAEFREELTDRYGKPPAEAAHILLKIMIRILCMRSGVKRLDLTEEILTVYFSPLHQKNPSGVMEMVAGAPQKYRFTSDTSLQVTVGQKTITSALVQSRNILKEMVAHVNS